MILVKAQLILIGQIATINLKSIIIQEN